MSSFKTAADQGEVEDMKAIAHLPGLDIEILHRPSPDGRGEQLAIMLTAVPSFDAWAKSLEMLNPLALWAEAVRFAWSPWLEAMEAMLPAPLPRLGPYRSDRR